MSALKAAWRTTGRLLAGPLALAAFFLPWGTGPGPLAATEFTGLGLVGFAGRLQVLELGTAGHGLLLAVRLLVLGVAIAAAWRTVLAIADPRHRLYGWSGGYLAASACAVLALRLAISGLAMPPGGLALLLAAAMLICGEPATGGVRTVICALPVPRVSLPARRAREPFAP
ncbi:MAG: hypothetical protein IT302_12515 [Dehalococcoidia bacterium]|nr:hypothetical protein [Dehalococcoidia bacterium]